MKDIECNPYAPFLIESTRSIGYSVEAAVADIIDNSISANADNVNIYFGAETPYIAIIDDGFGMDSHEITEAMRFGSADPLRNRDENDLGRYGLGMKTASLSQCRKLTVLSKKNETVSCRRWDIDYVEKTGKWSLIDMGLKEAKELPCYKQFCKLPHGTMVLWQDLDKLELNGLTVEEALENKIDDVREHLSLVFHRFLSGESGHKLLISINNVKLNAFDPFFVAKSTAVMDTEKIEIPGRRGKVLVTPFILPHASKMTKSELEQYGGKEGLRGLQGFYIYRNYRLLTWGTWFGLRRKDEFTKLARVRVDIPNTLDDLWTLDVKKSTAYPPEIIKTRLRQLISTISKSSERTYSFRKRVEINKQFATVWDKTETREGIRYEINKNHPVYKALNSRLDEYSKTLLKEYVDTVENNLPFNNIYIDMSKDSKLAEQPKDDTRDRIIKMAEIILADAKEREDLDARYEELLKTDEFKNYEEDLKKIKRRIAYK